jgi:hypothetical protein
MARQDTALVTRRGGPSRLLGVAGLGKLPSDGCPPSALQALGRQAAAAAQAHRAATVVIAVVPATCAAGEVRLLQQRLRRGAAWGRVPTASAVSAPPILARCCDCGMSSINIYTSGYSGHTPVSVTKSTGACVCFSTCGTYAASGWPLIGSRKAPSHAGPHRCKVLSR